MRECNGFQQDGGLCSNSSPESVIVGLPWGSLPYFEKNKFPYPSSYQFLHVGDFYENLFYGLIVTDWIAHQMTLFKACLKILIDDLKCAFNIMSPPSRMSCKTNLLWYWKYSVLLYILRSFIPGHTVQTRPWTHALSEVNVAHCPFNFRTSSCS